MKKLPIKFIQLLALLGLVMLSAPFFLLPEDSGIMGNGLMPHELHSGLSFIRVTVGAYFTGAYTANKSLVIIAFTAGIIMLMQLVAALAKRDKLILSTAVVLFGIAGALLVYIMQSNTQVIVKWGYYAFMVIQLVLAVFTPIQPTVPKQQK